MLKTFGNAAFQAAQKRHDEIAFVDFYYQSLIGPITKEQHELEIIMEENFPHDDDDIYAEFQN